MNVEVKKKTPNRETKINIGTKGYERCHREGRKETEEEV
jgi:hypothetical protein